MTTAGNTLGTVAYMAPERLDAGYADPRSDMYALTCVLYECLIGSRPYPADSLEQQIAGHMVSRPPRPSATEEKLAAFDDVIAKGMAKMGQAVPNSRRVGRGRPAGAECARAPGGSRHWPSGPARLPGASRGERSPWQAPRCCWSRAARSGRGCGGENPNMAGPRCRRGRPGNRNERAERHQGDRPAGDRCQRPLRANEFKTSDGQIVGFDVDLMNAMAKTLGLAPDYRRPRSRVVPFSVQTGQFNVGMSSVTDTAERRWTGRLRHLLPGGHAVGATARAGDRCRCRVRAPGRRGDSVDPGNEGAARQERCVCRGGPDTDRQGRLPAPGQHHRGVDRGGDRRDGGTSPVTGFAVKLSAGRLSRQSIFDSAPYGWPVAKGSPLTESLRKALAHLMQTGDYRTIATMWGVDKGMIDKPAVNGAIN